MSVLIYVMEMLQKLLKLYQEEQERIILINRIKNGIAASEKAQGRKQGTLDKMTEELEADINERVLRNKTENRLKNKASKRDIEASNKRLIYNEDPHRLVSLEGEIPFENYLRINNENIEAKDVAKIIKEKFNL